MHTEPEREGDFVAGLKIAFFAEALVVCAIIIAISLNVNAIADASSIITDFFQ